MLPIRRGQRELAARHVARLDDVVEHDVPGRAAPLEPAVRVGLRPELERPVPAPGVRAEDGAGDRLALDVDDLDAERRARLRERDDHGRGPCLDPDVAELGREALGLDRDDASGRVRSSPG